MNNREISERAWELVDSIAQAIDDKNNKDTIATEVLDNAETLLNKAINVTKMVRRYGSYDQSSNTGLFLGNRLTNTQKTFTPLAWNRNKLAAQLMHRCTMPTNVEKRPSPISLSPKEDHVGHAISRLPSIRQILP